MWNAIGFVQDMNSCRRVLTVLSVSVGIVMELFREERILALFSGNIFYIAETWNDNDLINDS